MNVECVLDTNVLIYAVGGRGPDEWKRVRAFEILEPGDFGTSGQILAEFFVNATRKIKNPLSPAEASAWVERLSLRPVAPVDDALVNEGILLSMRYRISYWDGAVIAAAQRLGAPTLYTEDLNHGQTYADVRVINPFRPH